MDLIMTDSMATEDPRRDSIDSGFGCSPKAAAEAAGKPKRKKKKRLGSTMSATKFNDLYTLRADVLGQGSYGRVETCANIFTGEEFAVKIVDKESWAFSRPKMLKEIELYYLCRGHPAIIQLVEYFEEPDCFYLIFEKARSGHLLRKIQQRGKFGEPEAAAILASVAKAVKFLHAKGIAHRDLKPENILCMGEDVVGAPVKLCDFDLCSSVQPTVTTPRLQSPVGSAEFMAPEMVDIFASYEDEDLIYDLYDDDDERPTLEYDKRCDLWSLGVIAYALLSGLLPFCGRCGRDCGWDDREAACLECQQRLFDSIRHDDIIFPDPYWSGVSDEAKDLILRLLRKSPADRIEAADVLDHPWIRNGGLAGSPSGRSGSEQQMKKSATSACLWPSATIKPTAKMRRQSSVVTFIPHPDEPISIHFSNEC